MMVSHVEKSRVRDRHPLFHLQSYMEMRIPIRMLLPRYHNPFDVGNVEKVEKACERNVFRHVALRVGEKKLASAESKRHIGQRTVSGTMAGRDGERSNINALRPCHG